MNVWMYTTVITEKLKLIQSVEAEENTNSSKHWKLHPVDEAFTPEEFNMKTQISEGAKAKDFWGNTKRQPQRQLSATSFQII